MNLVAAHPSDFYGDVLSAEACLLIFTFVKDDFHLQHFSTAD
jgi:hypothetical protein